MAVTAGIDFGAASFLNAYLNLQFGYAATPAHTITLFGVILLLHAVVNTFRVRVVGFFNTVSVWWHLIGVVVIVGALLIIPDKHQSPGFVFTEFVNNTGWGSAVYVALIGLLMAQYTFTGYDASAHMTEETKNASVEGPKGIVRSIVVSWAAGFVLLFGLTFAIQSYNGALESDTGVPCGADLPGRARCEHRQADAARHHRRPAVLRDGFGDRQLPHDLRLLPRRGAAVLLRLAQAPPRDPHPDQRRVARRRMVRSSSVCRTCSTRRRTPPSPPSRRSASTSRTWCPLCCGCARERTSGAVPGTWGAGRSPWA